MRNNVIVKTYEERMNMTEDRTKIGYELKEQSLNDMIGVLKDEVAEYTVREKEAKSKISKLESDLKSAKDQLKLTNEVKDGLANELEFVNSQRDHEKSMVRTQINELRQELMRLRENSSNSNVNIKEEAVSLREEIVEKDAMINDLSYQLTEAKRMQESNSHNTLAMMSNLEEKLTFYIEQNAMLKNDMQSLQYHYEQQRIMYEEKIKRRDEHRKKRKDEWARIIKEKDDQLRNISISEPSMEINADTILRHLTGR